MQEATGFDEVELEEESPLPGYQAQGLEDSDVDPIVRREGPMTETLEKIEKRKDSSKLA